MTLFPDFPQPSEKALALAYVRTARRPAVEALWKLDGTLAAILPSVSDPMIARIRLAWWREALESLDTRPAPAEPVLQALAREVLPAGVSGAALSAMEEGWQHLLERGPLEPADLDGYAVRRGGLLFRHTAVLLDVDPSAETERAGQGWALADLARRSSRDADKAAAVAAARVRLAEVASYRWPRRLRPIGMLAMLARRDVMRTGEFEREGAPARMLRMITHYLTGR